MGCNVSTDYEVNKSKLLLQGSAKLAKCYTWGQKREGSYELFDFFLHDGHSLGLRTLELVGGAAEVTQDVMALVMKEDVLHLPKRQRQTALASLATSMTNRHVFSSVCSH